VSEEATVITGSCEWLRWMPVRPASC